MPTFLCGRVECPARRRFGVDALERPSGAPAVRPFLASLPLFTLDPKPLPPIRENHLRIFQGRLSRCAIIVCLFGRAKSFRRAGSFSHPRGYLSSPYLKFVCGPFTMIVKASDTS